MSFPASVPGHGRCSFLPQVPLAFEPISACPARTALCCLRRCLHCTLPSSCCCRVISLYVLVGSFSSWNCPIFDQKASHFVPFCGIANSHRLEKTLRPLPWLLRRSAESMLVWKQHRAGVGFSIGVRCGAQDEAAAAWLANATQPLVLGLAFTSPAAAPRAPWDHGRVVFPARQEALQSS